jgi:hypothetical protein
MDRAFDPNVTKTVVFSAPFRRKFFEPAEPPFTRSFAPRLLIPPPTGLFQTNPSLIPIIGPSGKKSFRVSEVRAHLQASLMRCDEKIHGDFVKQLSDYLSERWRERDGAPPADADADLPSVYN